MNTPASLTGSQSRTYTTLFPVRKLIEHSEMTSSNIGSGPDFDVYGQPVDHTPHVLLVIDQHEARLFRTELKNGVPERLLPHEPSEYFRRAHHALDFSRGREKPDPISFFEPLTNALHGIARILVFGIGTGMSNVMDQFVGWAKVHQPKLAKRIIGSVVVDKHHLTEGQLLATARSCYGKLKRNEL